VSHLSILWKSALPLVLWLCNMHIKTRNQQNDERIRTFWNNEKPTRNYDAFIFPYQQRNNNGNTRFLFISLSARIRPPGTLSIGHWTEQRLQQWLSHVGLLIMDTLASYLLRLNRNTPFMSLICCWFDCWTDGVLHCLHLRWVLDRQPLSRFVATMSLCCLNAAAHFYFHGEKFM